MAEQTPSDNAGKILSFLERLKLQVRVHHHPPVFTVAEARALRGNIAGSHTKNLFLKDRKDNFFLVTAMEEAAIDLKTLHTRIGAAGRLSFGSAERLHDLLGVAPGAVSPLGLFNDTERRCRFVLDEAILGANLVNFHPLDNTMTVSISPTHLETFLAATGHTPIRLNFPSA